MPTQQPFAQYVFAGHAAVWQLCSVPGHTGVMLHEAGNELGSWPGHRMQVVPPQSLGPQLGTCVQRRHFVGSPSVSCVQFGDVVMLVAMS